MTYYGGKELAASFRTVRKNTIRIAQDIPEDQYGFVPAEGVRSVAGLLAHIAMAPRLFWQQIHERRVTSLEGFDFFGAIAQIQAEEARPRAKAEIVELLAHEGERFSVFLESLSEDDLAQTVSSPTSPGTNRSRFEMLLGAKEHEMHHRGQLMLIERQIGIVPHLTRDMAAMVEQMTKARAAGSGT
jgi:uncharacterized damage-inducible protein DinB